ncbi:MAG TPA: hypothetical protein DCQ28_07280 [Bacteroidetes bacterium]|nr:hypothetical protein [Bacteroidota bacterium]
MGLGQTLLTIMALMLMGRLILMVNRTTLETGSTKDMAEYAITATSLGTSILEYANDLAFDEATVDTFLTSTQSASLTAAASFGPDAGETNFRIFDDIDDYHGYSKIDTIPTSAIFFTRVTVQYLNVVPPSTVTVTTVKKFNKLISVFVTSPSMVDYSFDPGNPRPDTLKFQSVFSYWYFR